MDEPASERAQPYDSIFESQCRCATSELLRAAKFMSEDSDRRVFHRFDELRVFVLLRLQHRLAAMAAQLEALRREQDLRDEKGDPDGVKDEVLNDLAADIGRVLKDYGIPPPSRLDLHVKQSGMNKRLCILFLTFIVLHR
jgi:hypothetical protein